MTEIKFEIGVSKENLKKVISEIMYLLENMLDDGTIELVGPIDTKQLD